MKFVFTFILSFLYFSSFAQFTTAEDSLHRDSISFIGRTTIGGYGNAVYTHDFNQQSSSINLERSVLFIGHKFSRKISFFSELEVEDAKVSGGEAGGEIALEQCYLKFNVTPSNYFVAGLFLPRIGILNENHLPTTFNGNERTQVETFILPSTWRELGIGFYGTLNSLSYSAGIMNGLNSSSFEHGNVIREGRFEGRDASANNLAVTGALKMNKSNFSAQVSGYYGGSVGLTPRGADSLRLTSGFFGTPVIVGEADMQYDIGGFSLRILGSMISIPDAFDINRAYANNTPKAAYGAYCELAYNIFKPIKKLNEKHLVIFIRYEMLDMNSAIPSNGIIDGTLNQQHIVSGMSYFPVKNVVLKTDVRFFHSGVQNPDLILNPSPVAPVFKTNNTIATLGIGYSF